MADVLQYNEHTTGLYTIPNVGETLVTQTLDEIEDEGYFIAKRNLKNYNEIPILKSKVFINFIARKKLVFDNKIRRVRDTEFSFFTDPSLISEAIEFIPVLSGGIFRCVGEGIKDLRDYTYYIYENDVAKRIPDYQTLEVMLQERGISYTSIKVLSASECSALVIDNSMQSRGNEWNSNLGAATGFITLSELANNVSTLSEIGAALAGSAAAEQANVANQLAAQAAGMEASAAAASAESAAANTASSAAAASAAAAQASAAAASAAEAAAQASAAEAANSSNI